MKNTFLFDFDGTLADSMPFWHNNDDEFMQENGITPTPQIHDDIWALSSDEVADYYINKLGVKKTPDQIINDCYELMNRHYVTDIPMKKGAKEILKALKDNGNKICIVTLTKKETVKKFLKVNDIEDMFDMIFSCDSLGIKKSDRRMYELVSEKLNSKFEEMVFIEDSVYAVGVVKPLGITGVGIYEELAKDHWEEMKEVADYTIMDFTEWPEELGLKK